MRSLVDNRWFALTDLLLVMMSAAAWMLIPRFGIAFSLIALLPWVLRFLAGHFPFQRTPFDWLIAIFLATAWVSYWAAYDKSAAGIKFWLIVSAVLLYYALSAQPKQNLVFLSFLSFCFALRPILLLLSHIRFRRQWRKVCHLVDESQATRGLARNSS